MVRANRDLRRSLYWRSRRKLPTGRHRGHLPGHMSPPGAQGARGELVAPDSLARPREPTAGSRGHERGTGGEIPTISSRHNSVTIFGEATAEVSFSLRLTTLDDRPFGRQVNAHAGAGTHAGIARRPARQYTAIVAQTRGAVWENEIQLLEVELSYRERTESDLRDVDLQLGGVPPKWLTARDKLAPRKSAHV